MRRCDCVCDLDTPSVCAETPADDNEERILECWAPMQLTAGTQFGITHTRASRGLVDVKPREQIICNLRFGREVKLVRL